MGNSPVKLRRPATLDHLRSKPLPSRVVEIYLDEDARAEMDQALSKLEAAKLRKDPDQAEIRKLQKAYDAAKAACDPTIVEVLLRSVGRKRWEQLVRDHAPTEEQTEEVKEAGGRKAPWNADTFPPAAIAASLVEPQLTEKQVREEIWDAWNSGEVTRLFLAAQEVNGQSQLVQFGNFSNGTNGSTKS